MEFEDYSELKIFKKIWRSLLHRVASSVVVFPCVDMISWILMHAFIDNRYILNAKGNP
jgi:hypothetical protein